MRGSARCVVRIPDVSSPLGFTAFFMTTAAASCIALTGLTRRPTPDSGKATTTTSRSSPSNRKGPGLRTAADEPLGDVNAVHRGVHPHQPPALTGIGMRGRK